VRSLILALVIILIVAGIAYGVLSADISALPQPGNLETRVAAAFRNWYISRGAGRLSIQPPKYDASAVSAGEGLFGMACASCHGKDGRHPTNMGKSMYPRVPDLGSPEVQKLSNGEVFWVVKNGIRLSGMPGFGNILSNDAIWQVTYYVRTLGGSSQSTRQKD
jgi:mono/diheme cytochrome c family protein